MLSAVFPIMTGFAIDLKGGVLDYPNIVRKVFMASDSAAVQSKSPTYGRPRLLTHDEILDAAVDLGLEKLTMKKLSTHLNVGTATLYQYFDSRKTLMRAAAVHAFSDVPLPDDEGQHWSVLARDYVIAMQTLLAENPSYIHSNQHTDYGFEIHFKLIERFLEALSLRGFTAPEGMKVFNVVGMTAFAGAIEIVRQQEFELLDETMPIVAKRQFERLSAEEFPRMTEVMETFTQTPQEKVDAMLTLAFASIARGRGETEPTFEEG